MMNDCSSSCTGKLKAHRHQHKQHQRLRRILLLLVGAGVVGASLLHLVRTAGMGLGDDQEEGGIGTRTSSLQAVDPGSRSRPSASQAEAIAAAAEQDARATSDASVDPTRRMAIVLPYADGEADRIDRLLAAVEGWAAGGDGGGASPACNVAAGQGRRTAGLFFYGHGDGGDIDGLSERLQASPTAKGLTSCLAEVGALSAAGVDGMEEDTQSGGKQEQQRQRRLSRLFYRLLLDEDGHLDGALAEYTHVLWLDGRVAKPLRAHWLDAIGAAAAAPDADAYTEEENSSAFWVRGSPYYQGTNTAAGADAATEEEVGALARRLNGNALYALRDPEFETFLRIVRERRVRRQLHLLTNSIRPPTGLSFVVFFFKFTTAINHHWRTAPAPRRPPRRHHLARAAGRALLAPRAPRPPPQVSARARLAHPHHH